MSEINFSAIFKLFTRAVLERKQIVCSYGGRYREICPHIVGHTKGIERAQVYQFAGSSIGGLPPEGEYRCFDLDKVRDAKLRDGPWHGDEKHKQIQRCVEDVYVHSDLSIANQPGRRSAGR